MKKNIEPLQPDTFYHIYNRGINGENIFKEERNYSYFLQKYAQFVEPVAQTYAYCLLRNHFHLLVRTKPESEIRKEAFLQKEGFLEKKHEDKSIEWILSNAFASFFKSYAISINKAHKRTGALFEEPFLRKEVNSYQYFTSVLAYVHQNAQHHGFVKDFRDYPHSSYQSFLLAKTTRLQKAYVLDWFGGVDAYQGFHSGMAIIDESWVIELD